MSANIYACCVRYRRAAAHVMLPSSILLMSFMLVCLAYHSDSSSSSSTVLKKYTRNTSDLNQISSSTSKSLGSDHQHTTETSSVHLEPLQAEGPLQYLPPFEPACNAAFSTREITACLPMNCSRSSDCTVADKACCAYYNFQLLLDFDAFMVRKGLGSEYTLVYGTALGGLRNHTILPYTEDIDIAMSVHAAEALSQNSTRLELWAAGYAFWYGDFFRMCPHIWHPSPDFRALMQPYTHQQWISQHGNVLPVYMDAYLMWPKNSSGKHCDQLDFDGPTPKAAKAYLEGMHTLKGQNHRGDNTQHTGATTQPPSSIKQGATSTGGQHSSGTAVEDQPIGQLDNPVEPSGRVTDYCVWGSLLPISLQEGARTLEVGGSRFPAPINLEEHLKFTYGPSWRTPDTTNHGVQFLGGSVYMVYSALLKRLSVTAWGSMNWATRAARCKHIIEQRSCFRAGGCFV